MYVFASLRRPECQCVRAPMRNSVISSSLFLLQWPPCFVLVTWMVFEIRGKWSYICYLVGCFFQDLFKRARIILVNFFQSVSFKCQSAYIYIYIYTQVFNEIYIYIYTCVCVYLCVCVCVWRSAFIC